MKAINRSELKELSSWLDNNQVPNGIRSIIAKFIKLNAFVDAVISKNKSLLSRLREAMGFAPKSERGSGLDQSRGI